MNPIADRFADGLTFLIKSKCFRIVAKIDVDVADVVQDDGMSASIAFLCAEFEVFLVIV